MMLLHALLSKVLLSDLRDNRSFFEGAMKKQYVLNSDIIEINANRNFLH